jgi:hypothetical protein
MFITQAPQPDKNDEWQGKRDGKVHYDSGNGEPDLLMQPCPKESPSMMACEMHGVINMLREEEGDDPPQKQSAPESHMHTMRSEVLYGNQREENPCDEFHFFVAHFQTMIIPTT